MNKLLLKVRALPEYHGLPACMGPSCRIPNLIGVALRPSVCTALLCLSACGGSGGDAGDIATDNLLQADAAIQQDELQDDMACLAEIDSAEFFLTEIDRQWSCEISSSVGTRFDEIYFDRRGTASTAGGDVWYWNRNLPSDDINLASPDKPAALMTDIASSNTVLFFRTINEANVEELYDCVLVARESSS